MLQPEEVPEGEVVPTFQYLVALLDIADSRRRRQCGKDCYHWWHENLADAGTVNEIREWLRGV